MLASQSRYFAEALHKWDEAPSSHWDKDAEARTSGGVLVLDLVEENSSVVEGILYFLYNADYEDGSETKPPEIMTFNLLMSAAADTYGIPAMKKCALGKLYAAASKFWDTYFFLKVIPRAYNQETPAHDSDRAVLTLVAVEHAADLMEKTEFVRILGSNDQFRSEFEDATAENGRKAQDWPICMYCNRRHDPSECAHIRSG